MNVHLESIFAYSKHDFNHVLNSFVDLRFM